MSNHFGGTWAAWKSCPLKWRGSRGGGQAIVAGRTGMGLPILRPAVADLVFQVYGRPLHPEFFDILAVRTIQHADFQLTVRITRTGHVISWENADVILTEVTASA